MTPAARRRTTFAAAAIATALIVVVWWTTRDRSGRTQPLATTPTGASEGRLDVARFRARVVQQRVRAQALQSRRAASGRPPTSGRSRLADSMVSPRCIVGPADLCAAIADTVDDCDAGDGAACLAVGQYLQDLPPRPLTASSFFFYACKHGEPAGCDRRDALKAAATSPPAPCADDPLACAWQGVRAKDPVRLDEACAHGVADACAWVAEHYADTPARARAYLETACELGSPLVCNELARRLSPDCAEDCYPPDPDQATAASTIACEVGFDEACARLR